MEIKDIIKTDSDRLFIVDHECFIIYTGDSLDDEKPFIRIGNWINLPIELIPLIENIIITDSIVGNPSYEQFNIDIRFLATNRYIGSSHIVKRYLEYQRIYGLDLKNASIVNIEKDIPELSKEKNISKKNQFLGVFYRDGNYKTVHNGETIIDLKKLNSEVINLIELQNKISESCRNSERYIGFGLTLIEHNPLFYHKKHMISYLFPNNFFQDFSRLGIDPEKIKDIIYPSTNMMSMTKFLKWKNSRGGKLRIITDHNSHLGLIKKLFSSINFSTEPFTGMDTEIGSDLTITNYRETFNIKLNYAKVMPSEAPLSIAFIKGSSGVKEILKEDLDAIFISFSTYEDINLLFKSSKVPIAILDDGNKNISRLNEKNITILRQGYHYEFEKHNTIEGIYKSAKIDTALLPLTIDNPDSIAEIIGQQISIYDDTFYNNKKLFNLSSLILLHIFSTTNRKIAARLNQLYKEIQDTLNRETIFQDSSKLKIIIVFYNKSLFQFIDSVEKIPNKKIYLDEISEDLLDMIPLFQDTRKNYDRIIEDRKRLMQLLSIYMKESKYYSEQSQEVAKLKKAIEKRKKLYQSNDIHIENLINQIENAADAAARKEAGTMASKIKALPTFVKITLLLLPFIIMAILLLVNKFVLSPESHLTDREIISKNIHSKDIKDKRNFLNSIDSDIYIHPKYIYWYANKVAIKNGYHPISLNTIKHKNPHWIYPQNVFVMLDGEKIVVKDGDTLWELSRLKLVELTIKFNKTLKALNESKDGNGEHLLSELKNYAFSDEHFKTIKSLQETYNKDNETKKR